MALNLPVFLLLPPEFWEYRCCLAPEFVTEQACCSGFSSAGFHCLQSTLLQVPPRLFRHSRKAHADSCSTSWAYSLVYGWGDAPKVPQPSPVESQTANWLLSCSIVTTSMEETPPALCPPWSTSRASKAHIVPYCHLGSLCRL